MNKKLLKVFSIVISVILVATAFAGCKKSGDANGGQGKAMQDDFFGDVTGDINYVMIYNPHIYTKTSANSMNTGDLGEYVEAIIHRGGDTMRDSEYLPTSLEAINEKFGFAELDMDRAGSDYEQMYDPYSVGDIKVFATFDQNDNFGKKPFQCVYAGEYCNIWTSNTGFSSSLAQAYGESFDNDIYIPMTSTFGKARFAENGRKVNILVTDLSPYTYGCFCPADTYTAEELEYLGENPELYNESHAIIHINILAAQSEKYKKTVISTLAHELQHNILQSSSLHSGTRPGIWINEAMSGYSEEMLYPGIQKENERYDVFESSNMIRHGQSLYNFDTKTTATDFDIGVYGSVFLLSEYLAKNAGSNVFGNVHDYWRTTAGRYTTDAEVIYESVSSDFRDRIDTSVTYDDSLSFSNEYDKWLSKMTLDFYLTLASHNGNSPEHFDNVGTENLLYDQISDTDIEGGGRIIVALKDGEFDMPQNADEGMIYVGLDQNFNVVTGYVYK